jgi:hypothetical protein
MVAMGCLLAPGCSDRATDRPATATTEEPGMTTPKDRRTKPQAEQDGGGITSRYHVVRQAYSGATRVLHVRLASGIYRFELVPQEIAAGFAAARDQDGFFLQRIEARFPSTHVAPGMPAYAAAITALGEDADGGGATTQQPKAPPPRDAPPLDLDGPRAPMDVGTATMLPDGTLHLQLRSETAQGIAEALLVIAPGDKRYAGMVKHLGGIKPGGSCAIPPFDEPTIDPDTVR